MQLVVKYESLMIRRNTHMRSLFIEYPRVVQSAVMASLLGLTQGEARFNLPVLTADANGIEVKLPAQASGVFDLQIKDGNQHISKRIAIQ